MKTWSCFIFIISLNFCFIHKHIIMPGLLTALLDLGILSSVGNITLAGAHCSPDLS